jgi:TPR repeat protein/serine/threonine protein kinase
MSGSSGGYCPICGKSYGPEADRCPIHGFLFQSRDALRPGVVIDGAYEILQRLGAGGMGETYLVRHAYLGENLVLKRIRPELAEDPLYQQSFLREAHSLAALRKLPAVVEIRNAWQTREGYLTLLLEYVEGGNLLQWLDTARGGGPLEVLEAVSIAADLAKALAAAHAIGVLHRDVKPQNILMRRLEGGGYQLKLCDFGLAVQRVEEMTREGTTTTRLGTPGYAAPEQYTLSSREQDARVDVFGLGMTLYRLAAGRLPWEASAATWPLVCSEQQRKSLRELRPELGREYWLESLLLRMTAVERDDRIATAAEALALMQEALAETRPAPATMFRPQPRVAPPVELPQPPPPPPGTSAVTLTMPKMHGGAGEEPRAESTAGAEVPAKAPPATLPPQPHLPLPELQEPPLPPRQASEDTRTAREAPTETLALAGAGGEQPQADLTAGAGMPAEAPPATLPPEPRVPPPAELQESPLPPPQASEDAPTEGEAPTETMASAGATGEEPQAEPTAGAEMPAEALPAALPPGPRVPPPAELQEPPLPPPQASEDTRTQREAPTETMALTGAGGEEPQADLTAGLEMCADAPPATLPPEPHVPPPAELQEPPLPPLWATEEAPTARQAPTETMALSVATGEEPQAQPAAGAETPAGAAVPAEDKSGPAPSPSPELRAPVPAESQQPLPPWPPVREGTAAEHEISNATAVLAGTGGGLYAGPTRSAEMPAGAPAPTGESSAQAPTELPEPSGGAVEKPAIEPPLPHSQPAPSSLSKRGLALAASGFAVIALALVWWSARPKPTGVPGNPSAQAGQTIQAPAPAPPAVPAEQGANPPAQPAAAPPDRELVTLRNSIVAAIRAKDWPKAGPLIDGLLAKFPTHAEALEWRKMLLEAKTSSKRVEPDGASLVPPVPSAELPPPAPPKVSLPDLDEIAKRAGDAYAAQDYATAAPLYQELAESGRADAMDRLGLLYGTGRGVAQDSAQALAWYRKSAENGDTNGMVHLAERYVGRDWAQSAVWYRKAAENGHTGAMNNLGMAYLGGQGVAQDDAQAVAWLRKSAEGGDPIGMDNLGGMYAQGRGVARDDAQAVAWYRKAAEKGQGASVPAMNNLGVMYANGRGVERDDAQAVFWYRKAAEQKGSPFLAAPAMNNLGEMYENGRGVAKDMAEAVAWYNKAAAAGNASAKANLKRLGQ